MKRTNYLLIVLAVLSFTTGCKNVNYKKTKSGLLYKIFPGNGKDPMMKFGNVAKFNVVYKLNDDSVLYSSYGKAPGYGDVKQMDAGAYNMGELFPMMKKGDSAVTVQFLDSLVKRGAQIPFPVHKGDRLVTSFKIIEVFASDSLARPDFNAEMEKDKPRQMKEQQEQIAKQQEQMAQMKKAQLEQQDKDIARHEKSGESAKELKQMESWLASKKIDAKKTGKGTYVYVQEPGTGAPAEQGKYLLVKYTGKIMRNDSTFESNTYPVQLGVDPVIRGWTEGLQLFKQGGKGTLYIPGFLAYGDSPGGIFKPFEALKFDVELLQVSDKPIDPSQQPQAPAPAK